MPVVLCVRIDMSVLNKIQIVIVIVVVAVIAMLVIAVFVNPIMAISGVYTMQEMYDSSYRAAFESMAGVDSEEFKVNANPDYEQYDEYILLPFTNIRRDGSMADYGYTVTAGDFYSTGTTHYAFDIADTSGDCQSTCPVNSAQCPDTAILAPYGGTVISLLQQTDAAYNKQGQSSVYPSSHVTLSLDPPFDGYVIYMAHMRDIPSDIKLGSHVEKGQLLGYLCSLGNSSGPHLHFGLKPAGQSTSTANWIDMLQLHSSITGVLTDSCSGVRGFTSDQLKALNERPKFGPDYGSAN